MSQLSRRERLEALLADDSNDPELHYAVAMEYLSEGNEEVALERFQGLRASHPNHVATYLQLGQLHQRRDDEDEARATFEEGIKVAREQGNEHAANEMTGFLAML